MTKIKPEKHDYEQGNSTFAEQYQAYVDKKVKMPYFTVKVYIELDYETYAENEQDAISRVTNEVVCTEGHNPVKVEVVGVRPPKQK